MEGCNITARASACGCQVGVVCNMCDTRDVSAIAITVIQHTC